MCQDEQFHLLLSREFRGDALGIVSLVGHLKSSILDQGMHADDGLLNVWHLTPAVHRSNKATVMEHAPFRMSVQPLRYPVASPQSVSSPLCPRGAAGSNPEPPPPSRPPQVLHVFLQIEIFGKSASAEGAEFFFFGLLSG